MPEGPLQGVGVLVTRPRTQATELVNAVENAGGTAVCFPVLEIAPFEALEAGRGENDGVVIALIELGQTGVYVAAQRLDAKIRTHHPELCLSTQARASEQGALRQVRELLATRRHQRIGMVCPFQHGGDTETRRHVGGHVLHGVHRDVGLAALHRDFEFLDEQALATDFLQAPIENLVATRRHRHEFDGVNLRELAQQGGDMLGLPQCKSRLSCCYTNFHWSLVPAPAPRWAHCPHFSQDSLRRRFTSATCRRLIISSLSSTCDPSRKTTRFLPLAMRSMRSIRLTAISAPRWMRTKRSPNSASSDFSESSIRSWPLSWSTETYF